MHIQHNPQRKTPSPGRRAIALVITSFCCEHKRIRRLKVLTKAPGDIVFRVLYASGLCPVCKNAGVTFPIPCGDRLAHDLVK
jgi:hypothetical protein